MKAAVFCVVALLALACIANAQTPKAAGRNATTLDDAPTAGARPRNGTLAGAVRNATIARRTNATAGAGPDDTSAATGPAPKDGATPAAKDSAAPAASPAPAKKSGAAVATTGFAAAVAGSVVLLQLVL